MFTARRLLTLIAAACLAAIVAGALYVLKNRPLTVDVAQVETSVPVEVFGLGTVEARVITDIGFEVPSAIADLRVDHGDMVAKGAVLARLDASEQEARTARALASVHAAEAAVARSETMVVRQTAVYAQKDEVNRRQQELVRKNVVSIEKAEEAAKELKVAEADLALANSDVTVARAAVETARADLTREQVLLDKHTLTAPFDAVVVARLKELGAAVKAGDPVYTLADPTSIWALAHVEEARAGLIAEGQPARVQLRSQPGTVLSARVARIGIESDRVSEERRVWVKCEQCPPSFHLGEQAEVVITVATLDRAVLVPELTVSGFDGSSGEAWVAENGTARRQRFTFSHRTLDGRLAITGTIPDGVAVITGPADGLREGRAVTIAVAAP